jgi:hypothetical protein
LTDQLAKLKSRTLNQTGQQFAVSGRNGSAGEVLEMSAANEIAA